MRSLERYNCCGEIRIGDRYFVNLLSVPSLQENICDESLGLPFPRKAFLLSDETHCQCITQEIVLIPPSSA